MVVIYEEMLQEREEKALVDAYRKAHTAFCESRE
jgi:hypothetical protein